MNDRARVPVVLFDLDGTVVRGRAGRRAMVAALEEVAGHVPPEAERTPFTGRTDASIAAELLRMAGRSPDRAAVVDFLARYVAALAAWIPREGYRATPGARAVALAVGEAAARGRCHPARLLTGNVREGARQKLVSAGLADVLPLTGGFGDEHEDRCRLAQALAATLPRDARPVVLGDAPADLAAGRSIGARVVLVATGPVPRAELASFHPDALLDDLADLDAALAALLGA